MDSRKFVLTETAIVAAGQALCVGAMIGIFAMIGKLDETVLWGGLFGALVAIFNFFFMAIGASLAADKAQQQNVKGGKALIRYSMLLRFVVMFVLFYAGIKSGFCHPIAMVLPVVFTRPILMVAEFFRKKGA